jgi:glutamine amidotransferase
MCRHLAYLGPPLTLRQLILEPPHGLYRQAWAPRRQRYGTVNADGFGVGWYVPDDPAPARYRRSIPIWSDPSFADVARVSSAGAVLAAVRSATVGTEAGEAAAAPYTDGRHLFSHNGALSGWPGAFADLAGTLPPADLLELEARCDSALLWALVRARLRGGAELGAALANVVLEAAAHRAGRYNLLLTDGRQIAATTAGDTLFYRERPGYPDEREDPSLLVASEPSDDGPGWVEVPDGSLLVGRPGRVTVSPLAEVASTGPRAVLPSADALTANEGNRL